SQLRRNHHRTVHHPHAAHCFFPIYCGPQIIFAKQVTVVTGALKNDRPTEDDHKPDNAENDIAVLKLDREISFVDKPCQCLVCLEDREPKVGDVCLVSGTGALLRLQCVLDVQFIHRGSTVGSSVGSTLGTVGSTVGSPLNLPLNLPLNPPMNPSLNPPLDPPLSQS
ncbi:hypothetical protein BV898_10103, partial [Hypsibius exemplaris]